jgi:hypothetical protein
MAIVVELSGNGPVGLTTEWTLAGINRTNAGTPVSALTPEFQGERVYDTSNAKTYVAFGTAITQWREILPPE